MAVARLSSAIWGVILPVDIAADELAFAGKVFVKAHDRVLLPADGAKRPVEKPKIKTGVRRRHSLHKEFPETHTQHRNSEWQRGKSRCP
jgi:hypothetical protein